MTGAACGATVRSRRMWIASCWDLVRASDEVLLPNPDFRAPT